MPIDRDAHSGGLFPAAQVKMDAAQCLVPVRQATEVEIRTRAARHPSRRGRYQRDGSLVHRVPPCHERSLASQRCAVRSHRLRDVAPKLVSVRVRVKIGPQAVVQGCILGDNTKISEQSILLGSVFANGVSTCPRGWSKLCVVYPNASAGRMQALLVGKNTFMASLARFLDVKFKGTIKVQHKGKLVDTGINFLGGCLGHDAILGPDIWVAPGREIPNKAMVIKDPADIIHTVPSDTPEREPLTVSNGKLVPLKLNKNTPEKPEA